MVIDGEDIDHNDATGEGSAKNVTVTYSDGAVIKAQTWTWNDHRKIAHAQGGLQMSDDQMDATGDKADVYYAKSKRLLVVSGNVHITIKPRPEGPPAEATKTAGAKPAAPVQPAPVVVANGKATVEPAKPADETSEPEARRYPIEVTCAKVEYSYAKDVKHAVMTGDFVAIQKLKDSTRTVHAKLADWYGVDERAILRAPVRFEDTLGRHGETDDDAEISTKKGAEGIHVKKRVHMYFPVEEEEGGTTAKPAPPAKSGAQDKTASPGTAPAPASPGAAPAAGGTH